MRARRIFFFATMALAAVLLLWLMGRALAPGGWSVPKLLLLACFASVAPWLGICAANALAGFAVRVLCRDPALAVLPVALDEAAPITARIALAVTVRNEDLRAVLRQLRPLLDGLAADGDRFALFVLSDTQDAALAEAEEAAIAACGLAVRYRRRPGNGGFKAGNIMEFLDRHADGFDFAVVLDADSTMSADSVRRLVRIMQAAPRMGIVQHLTCGRPATAAFPRLFQFGMRAGMRIWATGQAWWQGDEGPYWGHNAIIRIAAFRAHCRLPELPGGGAILSHDQMEAALMRGAGWGVCVWADDDGSQEANPPALPEFLHRDARWLAGNLQYGHLLALPGLRPMGRWQLVQAIMLFAGAPAYAAMFALAAAMAATGEAALLPHGRLLALASGWSLALYAPKLLGYAEILLSRDLSGRYGGFWRFAAGACMEIGFTLLLDALACISKTLAMLRLACGARPGWLPQNRGARGVGWMEAARMFWLHTACGAAGFAMLGAASIAAALWALPFAGGLLVAVPFCVVTSSPAFSGWLVRRGIAALPEEACVTERPQAAAVRASGI
jgi:membrane glycosyltransferase